MRSAFKSSLALLLAAIAVSAAAPSRSQDDDAAAAAKPAPAPLAKAVRASGPKLKLLVSTTAKSAAAPTSVSEGPVGPSTTAMEAFVDGVVAEAMRRDHIAGVTVSVVQNGQVVLKKGYGFAGPGRTVDPDRTLFRLGQVTAGFTWIALVKEAETGRIRLDAPINLFLPETLRLPDQGFHRDVAVRDLMTHSAGFEDRTLGQQFEIDPDRVRPLNDYLRQERPRRVREPGALPSPTDYDAALAGAALAYADGRPFDAIIEGDILRPLGLAHTSLHEPYPARSDLPAPMPGDLAGDLSSGYRWRSGGFEPQGFEYASQAAPAIAASSTAADMGRLLGVILGGGQADGVSLYDAAAAQGFRTTTLAASPGLDGWDDGFAEISLPGGYRGQGLHGDTLWFHASLVTVPALNLGVFVADNTDTGARLAHDLPGLIVGRFFAPPAAQPRAGAQALADQADAYEGTFLSTRRPYGGLGKFIFMLSRPLSVRVTEDGRLLTQGDGRDQAWTLAPSGDRLIAVDGPQTSQFLLEDGRAERWLPPGGQGAYDRAPLWMRLPVLLAGAGLTLLAALLTLGGLFARSRRDYRQTAAQSRANLLQTTVAVLWLVAFSAFAVWVVRARDFAHVMFAWPGASLLVASTCAFVAAILTLLTLLMAPFTWRGGRRLDSWGAGRKFGYSVTSLVFTGFSVLLGLWGALEPWSR